MGMLLRRHYPQKPVETEVVNETEVVTYNDLTVKELRDKIGRASCRERV